jgi:hypothetical protein
LKYSLDGWITAFKESFDQVTVVSRDEWDLVDVYALGDYMIAVVVDQGPHQFGRRYRLESLNNNGFRDLQHPGELAMILMLGEILEPHALDSRPSTISSELRYPRAIWGGEQPLDGK